jgi:signal transduction histidine kinase
VEKYICGNGTDMTRPTAEATDTALEDFAARVAHDVNNLLTGILGNLELLQMRVARNNVPGLDSYLDGANSAGTRAVAFTGRLMAYSGQGGGPPQRVPVDAVLATFIPQAACSLAAGAAGLQCDPAQLEQAVAELLANAKAAGGAVALSSAVAGETITITIRDTGHGMTPEILARAQEPFFTTASNGTGRGLGLAIAARVVREIGGSLAIESQPGSGCTVTLVLPRS